MGDAAPLPGWYNDLEGFERACWRAMARGSADRRSPFHTPVLASIGLDGCPEARTIVLRGVDEAERMLRFHSDLRAAKVAALRRRPDASVLFYDKAAKLQVRARGRTRIETVEGAVGALAWERTRSFSRDCYRTEPPPGSPISSGDGYAQPEREDDGAEAFGVILVTVYEIEALFLASQGHRRARFAEERTWLVP